MLGRGEEYPAFKQKGIISNPEMYTTVSIGYVIVTSSYFCVRVAM